MTQHKTLNARIEELGPWFHNMDLDGVKTAPQHFLGDYPAVKYRHFRDSLPADMTGRTVLDIGCNAGFYSLEMKRRGAQHVVGIDTGERYLRQARFAAQVTGLEIDFLNLPIWDVAQLQQKFDLVIFMGVLYHLRHPLLALDLIHEHAARDLLLFQSMQRGSREVAPILDNYDIKETSPFDQAGYPRLHFIEQSYSQDPTNWWIPNRACTEAMLRSAGFHIQSQPEDEVYVCQWRPVAVPPDGSHAVYPLGRR